MKATTTSDAGAGTHERILVEASWLIAKRGYTATTTRQIADRVGIQQPSLFYHFASKAEIVAELLAWDLGQILPVAEALAKDRKTDAPTRLFRYLTFDVDHLMTAPYNLGGVFNDDVMSDPAFATWADQRVKLHSCVERMIRDGVKSGAFVPVTPHLIAEVIAGVLVGVLTFHSGGRRVESGLTSEIVALLLRGLMVDPQALVAIQAAEGAGPA